MINIILILCLIASPALFALAWYLYKQEQQEQVTVRKVSTKELVRGINLDIKA